MQLLYAFVKFHFGILLAHAQHTTPMCVYEVNRRWPSLYELARENVRIIRVRRFAKTKFVVFWEKARCLSTPVKGIGGR